MIAIITGDIINSRRTKKPSVWIEKLKTSLNLFGKENKNWEIYRGDSFQLEIQKPEEALQAAILIKAYIKTLNNIDVRMAIGIGTKSFNAKKITESNGEAFEFSGHKFESLKKEKLNLAIQTKNEALNKELNLMLRLALIAMDNWSTGSAELVKTMLEKSDLSQQELGELLGISQSSVSERYKRAYFFEVNEFLSYYQQKIKSQIL